MKNDLNIQDVITVAKRKGHNIDKNLIQHAYLYAKEKHQDQKRKSGEAYIVHPLNVAFIVADMGLDTAVICAALLHDVVEDTKTTYEDIKEEFNVEIAELVEGVTKITQMFKTNEEKQAENFKKLFIAMEKDIRVILLKLADRLHNVSTLKHLERKKQISIAKETIDIYAPIANKLGMYDFKSKLEDYSFKYLYPEEYEKILNDVETEELNKKFFLDQTKINIEKRLRKYRIPAIIDVERKHLFNIYLKLQSKKIAIQEMKDLFAIKIIVKDKKECYIVLGIINEMYNFIPGTFKDYIAVPRNNMYEALQSGTIGEKGVIFEAQICSYEMNRISKYGILAYLTYMKTDKIDLENSLIKEKFIGVKNSLELKEKIDNPSFFLNAIKQELFEEEVYVFTPKGKLVILPKGATAIDFAYKISENLGNHILTAMINEKEMPVITKLENGDIVKIVTTPNEVIPNINWLDIVKTAKAKSEILKQLEKVKEQNSKISVKLEIIAKDKEGIVLEILEILKNRKQNILSLNTNILEDKIVKIVIVLEVDLIEFLDEIKTSIENMKGVKEVFYSIKVANGDGEKWQF